MQALRRYANRWQRRRPAGSFRTSIYPRRRRRCLPRGTGSQERNSVVMYRQASPFGDKRQVVGIIPSP